MHDASWLTLLRINTVLPASYPLTPSAFDEIKEQEDSKFRALEKRFDAMQSMVEKLVLTVTKAADPNQQTELVKSMYESGWLKVPDNISDIK